MDEKPYFCHSPRTNLTDARTNWSGAVTPAALAAPLVFNEPIQWFLPQPTATAATPFGSTIPLRSQRRSRRSKKKSKKSSTTKSSKSRSQQQQLQQQPQTVQTAQTAQPLSLTDTLLLSFGSVLSALLIVIIVLIAVGRRN